MSERFEILQTLVCLFTYTIHFLNARVAITALQFNIVNFRISKSVDRDVVVVVVVQVRFPPKKIGHLLGQAQWFEIKIVPEIDL